MKNDNVEVRLLKPRPAASENTPAADQPGFILFRLDRGNKPCPNRIRRWLKQPARARRQANYHRRLISRDRIFIFKINNWMITDLLPVLVIRI
jgi:hypothetical protein